MKRNLVARNEINEIDMWDPLTMHAITDTVIPLCDVGDILAAEQSTLEK